MNKLEVIEKKSIYKIYEETYLDILIDGKLICQILDEKYPHENLEGLVPTLINWLEDEKEREIVWERILPKESEIRIAPILMCPDDCDFFCTIIIAEIERISNIIKWNRFGIDITENSLNPNSIGSNVEWLDKINGFEFDIENYKACINKFRENL